MDIAQRAGISQMTVSSVLRGKGGASRETAERILNIARELGYRPNLAARATVTGRFNCIGLILSTEEKLSNTSRKLLDGISLVLSDAGLHLAMAVTPDQKLQDENFVPTILQTCMCDGLLINYTHHIPPTMRDLIDRYHIPSIWINSRQSTNCVYPDDLQGARALTRHLIGMGHKRIVYVDLVNFLTFNDKHYSAIDRQQGYIQAMTAADLKPRVVELLSATDSRLQIAHHLLSGPERPSAIICYGKTDALAVLCAAQSLGMQCPRDFSLASFDHSPITLLDWQITTAIVPDRQVGRLATQMLLDSIQDPQLTHEPTAVSMTLDAGQTCIPNGSSAGY
jgi:LacI family transcriptional regulator